MSGFAGPANAPYKVRMLIWRPPTPEQSTGVVVAEPTHRGGGALICQFARYGIGQRPTAAMRRLGDNDARGLFGRVGGRQMSMRTL